MRPALDRNGRAATGPLTVTLVLTDAEALKGSGRTTSVTLTRVAGKTGDRARR
ncbi:hypothetical protein [Actinoplanes sp. NPDC051411]|uniref:hypothetical protein n=1 Tax=Actinoplanes sp. NPDC051411 TaxID=3155522 RepID=UPI00341B2F59